MLRASGRVFRQARRHLSVQTGGKNPVVPPTTGSAQKQVADNTKSAVTPPPSTGSIGSSTSTGTSPTTAAAKSSSTGSSLPKLLLFGVLSTPAAVAIYVKQNPDWNPEMLRKDENWIKFRELVLGKDLAKPKNSVPADRQVVKVVPKPAPALPRSKPLPSHEEFSAAVSKGQEALATKKETAVKKPSPVKKEPAVVKNEPVVKEAEDSIDYHPKKNKNEAKSKSEASKKTEIERVHKAENEVKKDVKTTEEHAKKDLKKVEKHVEKDLKKVEKHIKKDLTKAEEHVKKAEEEVKKDVGAVAAAAVAAAHTFEEKVDAAAAKAREDIDKLAAEANPVHLAERMTKNIQSTTKELLHALESDNSATNSEIDQNYLKNIHDLDSNALAIRVAQLATEMKNRSKWEAVRLVEALRRMEEDAQKKSSEVLRRQDELHKELLARELRLQEEVLNRQYREEMEKLKKQYALDLANNVNQQRSSILTKLQQTFVREKKIIEDRFARQLKQKSEELQDTLTKERKLRLSELEDYRAQLRALNDVLDNTSTYEMFSHQVHKASVAALALSDRIEAAAPLRSEIRALRETARNDVFIETALKSLPQSAVDEGAPSVAQLEERFKIVKSAGRRAALVPENSGIVGQLFGGALSYLMIPPGGPIEGKDTDAVLSRAEYALKTGDIEKAVVEMKGLTGLPAQLSRDWIAAAETRLAVEQTAKMVKAHIALLAASCS